MFGSKKKQILANGIQARAVITNVADTGVTINDNPRVQMTLSVQPDGDTPFEATKKATVSRLAIPRVGDSIWVRYDPADTRRVELDVAKTNEATAGMPAARAQAARAQDPLDQLKKLSELRDAGALTDAEFAAQKAKILGGS